MAFTSEALFARTARGGTAVERLSSTAKPMFDAQGRDERHKTVHNLVEQIKRLRAAAKKEREQATAARKAANDAAAAARAALIEKERTEAAAIVEERQATEFEHKLEAKIAELRGVDPEAADKEQKKK